MDILNEPGVLVYVPEAVLSELCYLDPNDPATVAVRSTYWILTVPTPAIPDFLRPWRLGAGETSVLSLALAETETATADEIRVEVVLNDEKARRCAEPRVPRTGNPFLTFDRQISGQNRRGPALARTSSFQRNACFD